MTAAQFLSWAETRPEGHRYELVSGEPIAMSPERNRHNLVKTACWRALDDAVRAAGLDCTVLGDGTSVVVGDGIGTAMWREGTVKLDPPGLAFDVAGCFGSLAGR